MNSRERIKKSINFEETDKVPIDWGNHSLVGIHEIAYRNLLNYLNKEEKIIIHDPVQRLAIVSEDILEFFGVDTIPLIPKGSSEYKFEEDENGNFYDEFGGFFQRTELYGD